MLKWRWMEDASWQIAPTIFSLCLVTSSFWSLELSPSEFHLNPFTNFNESTTLRLSPPENRQLAVFRLPLLNSAGSRFDAALIFKILPLIFKAIHNPTLTPLLKTCIFENASTRQLLHLWTNLCLKLLEVSYARHQKCPQSSNFPSWTAIFCATSIYFIALWIILFSSPIEWVSVLEDD